MEPKPKTITLVFRPDGSISVETAGFTGKECLAASAPYEEALGQKVDDRATAEARLTPAEAKAPIKHRLG